MTDKHVPTIAGASFEDLKKTNDYEAEYWSARDLQSLLGYGQWRRFEDTIKRAIISCEQSGNDPSHHFASAGKMIELGSGSVREVEDYPLDAGCWNTRGIPEKQMPRAHAKAEAVPRLTFAL